MFDHVKHIRNVKDPEYFNNLSGKDKKSWSNFMILRALSMDQRFIEFAAILFRFFDIIPPSAMYKTVIGLTSSGWCPWIKSKKKRYPKQLLEFVANHYEISKTQAESYLDIYQSTPAAKESLIDIMSKYGYDDKDIDNIFKNTKGDDDE